MEELQLLQYANSILQSVICQAKSVPLRDFLYLIQSTLFSELVGGSASSQT
jgi:hypothetical protein